MSLNRSDAKQKPKGGKKPFFTLPIWPTSLAGQLIIALLLALVVAQMISFSLFALERESITLSATRGQVLERTASLVRVLNETSDSLHMRVIRAAEGPGLRYLLSDETDLKLPLKGSPEEALANKLERRADLALGTVRFSKLPKTAFLRNLSEKDMSRAPSVDPSWTQRQGMMDDPRMMADPRTDDDGSDFRRRMGTPTNPSIDFKSFERGNRNMRDRFARIIDQDMKIAVPLNNGQWLIVRTETPTPPSQWGRPFLVFMGVTAICILLVVIFTVRRLTAPLRDLERASRRLGRGEDVDPLPEVGPKEIRSTIIAFNAMQERLHRYVSDRTRMLAAVSHDLRTPITTMRLRAEFIDDDEMREKLLETLSEMQAMTDAVLAFAREDASQEETRDVNLAALIASMVEDYEDMGKNVAFEGPDNLTYTCRQVSLKRALRNLTENAFRYAGNAVLSLKAIPGHVVIEVKDDGPGIPCEKLDDVFAPFFRVEGSRNLETGGVGLGLSITRTIIRSHGGDVTLANRPEGGLVATITLPR